MRTKFKAWAEPFINEHKEIMFSLEDIEKVNDFCLEIGSGKGQFLIEMAKSFPDNFFIGVEKNVTCSGFTAKKLVEAKLPNAKLLWGDISTVFPHIKNKSVKKIFLNFSDPWPKKRHSKRRLTAPAFLLEYSRILKDEGEIVFKTDNKDLLLFTLEVVNNSEFVIDKYSDNYLGDDSFDKVTEYESDFRKEGLPIYRVILKKKK